MTPSQGDTVSHSETIKILSQAWDSHDQYASAVLSAFDLAKIARVFGNTEVEEILFIGWGAFGPPTMEQVRPTIERAWYTPDPSAFDDVSPELVSLFAEVDSGSITTKDLTYAARILQRYITLLHLAGKDY